MARRKACIIIAVASAWFAQSAMAAEWAVVEGQSSVGFTGVEQGAPFRGHFQTFAADIDFDPSRPGDGRIAGTVVTSSVETNNDERDSTLLGSDWFDSDSYPEARFEAARIEQFGEARYRALGELTVKGTTKPAAMDFTFDVNGASGAHLVGTIDLRRLDFGVGTGMWVDTSWVADEVTVEIDLSLER